MEVDHDLIAAGHPRLFFDYAAYHDLLPRHWKEQDDATFPAKAWAVGRLTAAHTALELLINQTKDDKRWPELSQFNCYSCHRGLTGDLSSSVSAARPVGTLGVNHWHLALLKELGVDTSPLDKSLNGLTASPSAVATAAEQIKKSIGDKLKTADLKSFDPKWAAEKERRLTEFRDSSIRDWDEATQHYLALTAMHRTTGSPAMQRKALSELREVLRFAPGRNSPPIDFRAINYLRGLVNFSQALEQQHPAIEDSRK